MKMSILAAGWVGLLMRSPSLFGYMPDFTQPPEIHFETIGKSFDYQQRFPFDMIVYHKEEEAHALLDRPVVISLSRRIDRFNVTEKLMEQAGFTNIERFEGVDAYRIKDFSIYDELGVHGGGMGPRGCAASHLWLWRDFLNDDDREFLFVGEDDLLPHTDFAQLFPLYWGKTPKGFDLVMVGNQIETSPADSLVVSIPTFCTHAYIISKAGAKRLLELYRTFPKETENMYIIDIFLIEMMKRNLITYYCYNGAIFPDNPNLAAGNIQLGRDSGICFQNSKVEVSIHGK